MIRAATYARFSTDKQTETSIDDQRRACREYAKANGMTIVHEFSDLAISGASFGNRPGVLSMQKSAFAGELDVIIIGDLTRLSRSSADLPKFLERMRFRKVRVIGVLDRFDSDTRVSRMQAGLSGIMSDEYRLAVGERVHLALDTLAKNGKPTGSKAYGYTSKHEIIPDQAKIVREAFARLVDGDTLHAIASDFNARGVASPGASWKRASRRRDGRWLVSALNALLQNEMYCGRIIWNRSQWIKDPETGIRTRRERPRSEWIIDEKPEIAIVTRKTFDEAQAIFQRRKGSVGLRGGGRSKFPLSGLLECGVCGCKFIMSGGGQNSRGYGARGARYYVCSSFQQGGLSACTNSNRVLRETVERKLFAPALDDLLSDASIEKALKIMRRMMRDAPPAPMPQVADVLAKVAKIQALVASGVLDVDMAEPIFAKLEAERIARVRVAQQAVSGQRMSGTWGVEAEYREHAKRLREDLTNSDASIARAALRTVYGERIRLIPEGKSLTAEIFLQANAVLSATGTATGRIQLGSGGPLCTHIPLI